jgi:hypothetical protein
VSDGERRISTSAITNGALLGLVAASLVAAGCGGGKKTPPTPAANAAPTVTAPRSSAGLSAQLQGAQGQISSLASTVGSSGLSCGQSAALTQQLGYVHDALNQGNLPGARFLMQVSMDLANEQAQKGLLSPTVAAQIQRSGTQVLQSVPLHADLPSNLKISSSGPSTALKQCVGAAESGALISEYLRNVIARGVDKIPVAGVFLSGLVEILWPSDQPNFVTWDQLSDYVDKQIKQAIDEKTKADLHAKLDGLKNVLHLYITTVTKSTHKSDIRTEYKIALNALEQDEPAFRPEIRPYLVLPEYAQLQNLLLIQLRDGIVNGASWGFSSGEIDDWKQQLISFIAKGNSWVPAQTQEAHKTVTWDNNQHSNVNRYNANAKLDDSLVPVVADQQFYWQYFDPDKYKPPFTLPPNARVLYTPAFGTLENNGTPNPQGAGKPPLVHATVWAYDRIDGVQVTYGLGSHPDPRMGNQTGGTPNPPKGGSFQLGPAPDTEGWITGVRGQAGDVPQSVGFTFTKGNNSQDSQLMGSGTPSQTPSYALSFPGEVVGYLQVPGVSNYYGSSDAIIYGFRYSDSYP